VKKLVLVMVLAAAAAALSCNSGGSGGTKDSASSAAVSAAGTKQAWIHFTKNYHQGTGAGQYDTPCVATVSTEQIGAKGGYKIIWHVETRNGGPNNDDDKCPSLDREKVSLEFVTKVMGMTVLEAEAGGLIQGTVSEKEEETGSLLEHKYRVRYDGKYAGPDPVIILNCSECGPPPTP
jgi:hypothetical protein